MSDEIDLASVRYEAWLGNQVAEYQRRANQPIETTGECLNCGEPLMDHGRRWCCHDCMSDWQKRNGGR
jgi:hypothetical protein